MKVAITNAVLSNTGDAAIYEGIVQALEARGVARRADIFVFDSNARVTKNLYPSWSVFQQLAVSPPRRPARLRNLLQRLRHALVRTVSRAPRLARFVLQLPAVRATEFARSYGLMSQVDVLISSGGTYLVDHYNFVSRAVELEMGSRLGLPVVLWTQSMGPFEAPRAATAINRIANCTDLVYFRDEKSAMAWLRAASGVEGRVVADAVFSLPRPTPTPELPGGKRRALLSVREWNRGVASDSFDQTKYADAMRSAARVLLQDDFEVTALSTCQGVPEYAYDDSALALDIFRGMDVTVNRNFHGPDELLRIVASADVVVTTRMHLAILALVAGVPVIAVAYEFKTLELFRSLGLDELASNIETVTEDWIASKLAEVSQDRKKWIISEDQLARLRASAMSPADDLHSLNPSTVRQS